MSSEWLNAHGTPWCFRDQCAKLALSGKPFVINLDSNGGGGTHWVAARLIGDKLFYADPFGTVLSGYPPKELGRLAPIHVVNRIAWQRPSTNYCGYYSYLFTKALQKAKPSTTVDELEHLLWKSIS